MNVESGMTVKEFYTHHWVESIIMLAFICAY